MHNTVVNVPAYEKTPEKKATLVVDVQANSELHKMFEDVSDSAVHYNTVQYSTIRYVFRRNMPQALFQQHCSTGG